MTHEQLVDLLRKTFPDAGPESLGIATHHLIGGGETVVSHYLTARFPLTPVVVQRTLRGSDAEVRGGVTEFAKEVAGWNLSREMTDVLIGMGMSPNHERNQGGSMTTLALAVADDETMDMPGQDPETADDAAPQDAPEGDAQYAADDKPASSATSRGSATRRTSRSRTRCSRGARTTPHRRT